MADRRGAALAALTMANQASHRVVAGRHLDLGGLHRSRRPWVAQSAIRTYTRSILVDRTGADLAGADFSTVTAIVVPLLVSVAAVGVGQLVALKSSRRRLIESDRIRKLGFHDDVWSSRQTAGVAAITLSAVAPTSLSEVTGDFAE